MSALYERSQLTQVMISSAPATAETWIRRNICAWTAPSRKSVHRRQKQDIDVTTLCSTEQENIKVWGRRRDFHVGQFLSESGPERPA
ncbi:putative phage major tail subunit [Escherichia coli 08BKT055439]|nr:putative phage major tail subunit [Escherichia coli 08BKT055439]